MMIFISDGCNTMIFSLIKNSEDKTNEASVYVWIGFASYSLFIIASLFVYAKLMKRPKYVV